MSEFSVQDMSSRERVRLHLDVPAEYVWECLEEIDRLNALLSETQETRDLYRTQRDMAYRRGVEDAIEICEENRGRERVEPNDQGGMDTVWSDIEMTIQDIRALIDTPKEDRDA